MYRSTLIIAAMLVSLLTLGAFSLGKPAWGASFSDAWCAAALDTEALREAETGKGRRYHRFDEAAKFYTRKISGTDYYYDYANALADISLGTVPYWRVQNDAKKCLSDYESTKQRVARGQGAVAAAELKGSTLQLTGDDWQTTSFKRLYEVFVDGVLVASQKSMTPPIFEIDAVNIERLKTATMITVETSSMLANGSKATTTSRVVKLKQGD